MLVRKRRQAETVKFDKEQGTEARPLNTIVKRCEVQMDAMGGMTKRAKTTISAGPPQTR